MPATNRNFDTARTRKFRATDLCEQDEFTISSVEEYGCSIVHVARAHGGYGWSYSIGVFDTCGKPEIITVGLPPETAHFALNEAATLLRSGVELTVGRHNGLVGQVDCEFRPVGQRWIRHLMNWAVWYYDGADFPVIQAVYPDRENRFPGESGFDVAFEQPLMQCGAPSTRVEDDFWASTDPKSSLFNWRFQDSPHAQAFLSKAVDRGIEPITFVSHDADDGAWQFLGDSMSDSGGVAVCLHHPIDSDPSLRELADLPLGWYAEREKTGQPWVRKQRE
ncbi:MAG: DUF4262 domain-containing protein [Bryobacteraceae bacterium]|jgi:hypothetical protein